MATSTRNPSVDFETWQKQIWTDPLATDLRGFGLLLVVLTITAVVGAYGLVLFPPVPLPRIVLAIPGLAGGALSFIGLRKIYFRAAPVLTVPVSLVVVAGGALALLVFFDVFLSV